MPAPIATPAQTAPKSDKAPKILVPFIRAAQEHLEPFLDTALTISGTTQAISPVDIPAYGFIRGVWIEVTATGGTGAAAVYKGDGPFSALTDVSINDVNGAPIVGPITGYDAFLIQKYGGYRLNSPKLHPDYTAPTNGNFSFMVYLPIECNPRDALGALANLNAASSYKLRLSLAAKGEVFSTDPSTLPSVRVRTWLDAWTQPADTDLRGNPQATQPPAHGTTSYWSKQVVNVSSGQQTIRLQRVGNMIRNTIFVYRDGSAVRNKSAFPASFQTYWDTRLLKDQPPIYWRGRMAGKYALTGADDSASGLDTGVYVEDYCHEFDGMPGAELRDGWLPTAQSTRLEVQASFGGAGTLTILTNDVSPAGDPFVN